MHNDLPIGYVPYSLQFDHPGDRRRFCAYAKSKNLSFSSFNPNIDYKLVVLSERSDFYYWAYKSNTPFVLDLIDSYFLESKFSFKSLLRSPAKYLAGTYSGFSLSFPRLLSDICRKASYIICSTPEQSQYIYTINQKVQPILDCYQVDNLGLKHNYSSSDPFRIVWEGQPNNLKHLKFVIPVLNELAKKYRIVLDIVTDSYGYRVLGSYSKYSAIEYLKSLEFPFVFHEWSTINLSYAATRADLAILPVPSQDKFVYNKPENRLLIFWSMGVPTLTSSTPAYKRTMTSAGLYDYCSDPKEWYDKLELFISSKFNRQQSGNLGLNYYLSHHTDLQRFSLWDNVFNDLGIL